MSTQLASPALQESIASMSTEQIADSLEIMSRCNVGFFDEKNGVKLEAGHIAFAGNQLIKGNQADRSRAQVMDGLNRLASEIEEMPQWQARYLVIKRAVALIETAP